MWLYLFEYFVTGRVELLEEIEDFFDGRNVHSEPFKWLFFSFISFFGIWLFKDKK